MQKILQKDRRPKVGVGVFVIKDSKILMLKRKGAHGEGTWSIPGGHLEFGEDPEQTASREVLEETGVSIKNIRKGPYTNDIFEKEDKHYITLFMLSDYESGEAEVKEVDFSEAVEWRNSDNLPAPLFKPLENLLKTGFDPFVDS